LTTKISDKDKEDWLKFINNKEEIENKDMGIKENVIIQQKMLDLHGYTIRDANLAVSNLILSSYNKGVKKLKIITGKGMRSNNLNDPYKSKDLSILKYAVPYFILEENKLMEMIDKIDIDQVENLNCGEFNIYLKKNEN
tara:strand:+ start:329 stop:745 length:417 start_codon:yes stop_codon:yes gene_type:complete